MWQHHEGYIYFVNKSWSYDTRPMDLEEMAGRLSSLQASFRSWDMEVFGSVHNNLKQLRKNLDAERGGMLYWGPTPCKKELVSGDRVSENIS
jgi:hypothetical protein